MALQSQIEALQQQQAALYQQQLASNQIVSNTMPGRVGAHRRVQSTLPVSMGAFGGAIAFGVGHMDGLRGLPAWRWLFIVEGIPSCLCAIVVYFMFPETSNRTLEELAFRKSPRMLLSLWDRVLKVRACSVRGRQAP